MDIIHSQLSDNKNMGRAAMATAGMALVMRGLKRRGVLGSLCLGAGGFLCWKAIVGKSNGKHSHLLQAAQEPVDAVEEASMESFPASDAPAHHEVRPEVL